MNLLRALLLSILALSLPVTGLAASMAAACQHQAASEHELVHVDANEHAAHQGHDGHHGHASQAADPATGSSAGTDCQCGCLCASHCATGTGNGLVTMAQGLSLPQPDGNAVPLRRSGTVQLGALLELLRPPATV